MPTNELTDDTVRTLSEVEAAEPVVVSLFLDLDPADAGRVLGISPSACTTRLSRALGRLEEKVGTQHVA